MMLRRGLVVLLSVVGSADAACDAKCRTQEDVATPYPNSIIGGYDQDNDCAWIANDHLAKTDLAGETKDYLGQCHGTKSACNGNEYDGKQPQSCPKKTTGLIELACGPEVSIAGFVKACAETTREKCADKCPAYLKLMNAKKECWSSIATIAVPKGFPLDFMCNWRTGCGLNELNGLPCTPKPPTYGLTATFDFILAFEGTIARLDFAIAEALGGINMADINVTLAPTTNRRLGTVSYKVAIGARTVAEADVMRENVQKPNFDSAMVTQCSNGGNTCSGFAVSTVSGAEVIPPMGGYVVPKYQAGKAVVQFHAWSPMKKDEKWEIDPDTTEGKAYLTNIAGISVMSMIFATIAMLFYWVFLCGHNLDCCRRCCGCCNKKGAWGGEKIARPLLALMFFVTLIVMCTSTTGANHFKDGLAEVGDVLGKVANIFDELEGGTSNLDECSVKMNEVGVLTSVENYPGKRADPNYRKGTGCSSEDVGPMFVDMAKVVSDASTELNDLLTGQSGKIRKMQKQLTEDGPPMLDALVMATVALFVPWTLFGLIGVGLGSKAPKISDCFLNVVAALGLLIMWIIAIMLAIELAIGVLLSDFCFSDPLVAMTSLINQNMDGDQAKLIAFYMDCDEGRGNKGSLLEAPVVGAQLMIETLGVLTEGVSGTSCSAATMNILTAPDTGGIALATAALSTVKQQLSCQNMNPLFVSLTHDAICESAVSGLLSLFNTQVVAGVFMLFTLHYASFVRPYMNKKEAGVVPEQSAADEKAAAMDSAPAATAEPPLAASAAVSAPAATADAPPATLAPLAAPATAPAPTPAPAPAPAPPAAAGGN